ncbi:MAG TPA: TfoX/Sxy family protein [Solirubrobacteraceae bacterium]|nr:TfoX/Sxy family protein [Solirubrobacteraceae bacterium]
MAPDPDLVNRIRAALGQEIGVTEKRMFGGVAFLVDGHMAVAASGAGGLLVRVDPAGAERLLARAHVQPMIMRGRAVDGWLRVAPEGISTSRQLRGWVARGVARARSPAHEAGPGSSGRSPAHEARPGPSGRSPAHEAGRGSSGRPPAPAAPRRSRTPRSRPSRDRDGG